MKKILSIAFSIGFFSTGWVRAQTSPEVSGVYQELTLGVDPAQGALTGYFKEIYDPPNLPHVECSFYLYGKKEGGHYMVQAWSPEDKKSIVTKGELSFFSADNSKPSVLLRLEKLDRDCTALKPNLAKGQGAFFDLKTNGDWKEVRMVAHPKSPYYQAPDLSAPARDSAKRGAVLTVVERRSDWAQVQADQKSKGWIREADLYPTSPSGGSAEPAPLVVDQVSVPAKQPDRRELPTQMPAPEIESKDLLIARLKVLNAQAFEMALQVLKNPTKRNILSAKRMEMERDFNTLVSKLKHAAPSTYPEESKEIFETLLDLQYVERDQPVVSLRLNQKIQ